jgi:hypothetical protein
LNFIRYYLSRIRRNHGLEHATIHVLSEALPGRRLIGRSDLGGFWLLGEVGTEELAEAVQIALARLRGGEHNLAVHPNCGTNYVTYGAAAGIGAFAALTGAGPERRDKLERLPLAALLATLGLILAQPLAFRIQKRVTTSGYPDGLRIVSVVRSDLGERTAHRIKTRG